MKIKQLYLKNYGPLADKEYRFTDGFNLLYGSNEKGKSLTFDALIKLLFGKESKYFSDLNRVEDDPASFGGFVDLQLKKGKSKKEVKLQGKPTLSELANLSPEECQNLFLIRNSELSIGKDIQDQDRFYTSITDRLTGLKTEEIEQAKQKLLDYAQLTETHRFQNTQENNKLGERLEKAQQLLEPEGKLSRVIDQDKKRRWSELENRLWNLKKEIKSIKSQLKEQEQAKRNEEYLALKNQVKEIEQLQAKLKPLTATTQDKLEQIRYAQQDIKRLSLQQKELEQELKDKQDKADSIHEKLDQVQQELHKQTLIKEEIDGSLQPESLFLVEQLSSIKAGQGQPWGQLLIISTVLLVASLAAAALQPHIILIILAGALFIPTFILGLKQYSQLQEQQKFDSRLNQLQMKLSKYDLESEDLKKITKQISELKQQFNSLSAKEASLSVEKKAIRDDIGDIKDKKLIRCKNDLSQNEDLVERLLKECDTQSAEQLKEKLDQKRQLESKLQQTKALVESRLGKPPFAQRGMEYYQRQLSEMSQAQNQEIAVKYSSKKCSELEEKVVAYEKKSTQIQQELESYQGLLQDLQRAISSLLVNRSEPIIIDSMSDLLQAKKELINFVEKYQQKTQAAIKLIDLLEELEQTEKQKVSQLFGKNSTLSQRFSQITQGRYSQVYYDQESHQIKVEQASQKQLEAQQLSSGTYDQLYFSIRVGLGEMILQGETGFFVMDDPFLKADQQRLEQQLEMLLDMSQSGWQIIYFTAKKEVQEFLQHKDAQLTQIS